MKSLKQLSHTTLIVIFLTLMSALLHFFNLNWGAPFYFHPDERNIASAVSQLQFPTQMNPHFFAYGSLPIYTIYFTGFLINFLSNFQLSTFNSQLRFEEAIIVSRVYSAFFATILIPVLFLIGQNLKDAKTGLVAAFLGTMSVGMIQFAHFGTFEMWLTFFSVLLFWLCLCYKKNSTVRTLFLIGVVFGILVAIKISSLAMLPLPLLAIALSFHQKKKHHQPSAQQQEEHSLSINKTPALSKTFLLFFMHFLFLCSIAAMVYIVTNPYVILDPQVFLSAIRYESSVGLNTLPVFYTGGFYDTIPVVYQFIKIYPFLLGPLLTILFVPAFIYLLYQIIKTKKLTFLLLAFFFLLLFLTQAFLFIKWTRYMIPTLPFIFLTLAVAFTSFRNSRLEKILLVMILVTSTVLSLSYFITAFVRPDTRIAALTYAMASIPKDAPILSETHDLGNTVFQEYTARKEFNFYDYDQDSPVYTDASLNKHLETAEYIILPSQRVLQPRLENPKQFPKGNAFYTKLTQGKLDYQQIYETPCDIFCQITYLGDPVYSFEQTANVFDRPAVIIFKNTSN